MVELIILITIFVSILNHLYIKKGKNVKKKSFHKPYSDTWKENLSTKNRAKSFETSTNFKKQYDTAVGRLLTLHDISKYFGTTQTNIKKIFEELRWIEIRGKWILPTVKGNFNGAREKYNAQTKLKYVLWEDDIYENEELIKKLNAKTVKKTSYKEKIVKGEEYEKYVAKVYRSRGYHVTEYGKLKGRKDQGIDLIAKKQKEIVLIQCKNWKVDGKWAIKHKDIKAFQTDARTFVEDKPLLRSCLLTARYTISGDFIHPSALNHIQEMQRLGKRVDYEIVKMGIL